MKMGGSEKMNDLKFSHGLKMADDSITGNALTYGAGQKIKPN